MIHPNYTNYHCHSLYCDGRADMDSFLRFAISEGFSSFGFSSHAPLPFPTHWTMEWDRMDDYLAEFARLKKKYENDLELAIGLILRSKKPKKPSYDLKKMPEIKK